MTATAIVIATIAVLVGVPLAALHDQPVVMALAITNYLLVILATLLREIYILLRQTSGAQSGDVS